MSLTSFGALVRKARIDARIKSLGQMSDELGVSPALLSGFETGRRKISKDWVQKIEQYFLGKGVTVDGLGVAADVSNREVSLEGLHPDQQMFIAAFARTSFVDPEAMQRFKDLFLEIQQNRG